jgi:hypothetical protein
MEPKTEVLIKEVRRHVLTSKKTPQEVKTLLLRFFEAGDWNVRVESGWLEIEPFEPPLRDIKLLTDLKSFTIVVPAGQDPPFGYCAVDASSDNRVYLRCLDARYPSTLQLDLDARLLFDYVRQRLKEKLMYLLHRI